MDQGGQVFGRKNNNCFLFEGQNIVRYPCPLSSVDLASSLRPQTNEEFGWRLLWGIKSVGEIGMKVSIGYGDL